MREDQEKSQVFVPGKGTIPIPLSSMEPEPQIKSEAFYKAGDLLDGKYLVKGFLGEGGMGAVYRVHHQFLGIDLALKTFRSAKIDQEAWLRFQREAQAIGKLEHENIVRIYDFGITKEQLPFYTMELLAGEPLSDKLQGDGPLTLKEAIYIFTKVASALAHAHHSGIVHRDVKPANIYISPPSPGKQGAVKLVDFGIAKLASSKNQALTSMGLIFGSPLYMSPEQAKGGEVDQRSDIYSLGCTIFECLTSKTPFEGDTIIETLSMHQQEAPPRLLDLDEGAEYPQRLEGMLRKMLAKAPEDRYQTMNEVLRELESIPLTATRPQASTAELNLTPRKVTKKIVETKKRTLPVIPLVAVVTVLGVAGFALYTFAPRQEIHFENEANDTKAISTISEKIDTAPHTIFSKEPFFIEHDGVRTTNFKYPVPVGKITDMTTGKRIDALDKFDFPVSDKLSFAYTPEAVAEDYTDEIAKFGPDSMFEMVFGPGVKPGRKFINGLSVLRSLRSVSFRASDTHGESARGVDGLPDLQNLDLGLCEHIKAKDVAKYFAIKRVKRLCLDEMEDIDPVLAKLRYSFYLNTLKVDGIPLTASQLKAISVLPALRILEANNCEINDAGLKILSTCKNLEKLYLGMTDLTKAKVEILTNMKSLKYLSLSPRTNQRAELAQLKAALEARGCTVDTDDPKPDYSGFFEK